MLLEFKNVTGISKDFALQNINFSLEAGYLMGIAGKNGAGKTTLMQYMINPKKTFTGEISLDGKNIYDNHVEKMNDIAYVSEENHYFNKYTARQNAKLLESMYEKWNMEVFEKNMKKMELSEQKVVGAMSRGEFMKFQMAFAMAHGTKLYLLDEVTGGMDPIFRKDFFKILKDVLVDEKASAILVTHIQEEIEIQMDYVGIMEKGKLNSFGENR